MKKHILAICLTSFAAAGCTLSLSDNNPKPVSLLGHTGAVSGSIAGGNLTLTGSNLDRVTGLALTQSGGANVQLGPFVTHTRSLLSAKLPSVLRLPGMLLVSSTAGAEQVELSTLDALAVDGTLSVTGNTTLSGTTDAGFEKVQVNCPSTTGFCSASCPAGKKLVSGGCFVNTATIGLSVNYPSADNQWTCRPTAMATVDAYVICGRVTLTY